MQEYTGNKSCEKTSTQTSNQKTTLKSKLKFDQVVMADVFAISIVGTMGAAILGLVYVLSGVRKK